MMNQYEALMEYADRRKPKYSDCVKLSQCYFAHSKFHIDWSGLNPRFRGRRLAAKCLSHNGFHGSREKICCLLRGRPETPGRPGQINNLAPLLTMSFKICYLREGRRIFLRARVQIEVNSRKKFFRVYKAEFTNTIFQIIPTMS